MASRSAVERRGSSPPVTATVMPVPLDDCRRAGRPTCRVIRAYAEDATLLGGPRDRLIDRGVIGASENQPGAIHVTINESAFR